MIIDLILCGLIFLAIMNGYRNGLIIAVFSVIRPAGRTGSRHQTVVHRGRLPEADGEHTRQVAARDIVLAGIFFSCLPGKVRREVPGKNSPVVHAGMGEQTGRRVAFRTALPGHIQHRFVLWLQNAAIIKRSYLNFGFI